MRERIETSRLAIHSMLDQIANLRMTTSEMTFDTFVGSVLHRAAAERMIEIVSEASRRITDQLKATEPDIPWSRIAGIGNVLRHDYDDVAPRVVWNAIEKDLAVLEAALRPMLAIVGDAE